MSKNQRHKLVFTVATLGTLTLLGIFAAVGIQQAALAAQSPFSVGVYGVNSNWSKCVARFDDGRCQTRGGTWWTVKTTTEKLTLTTNTQITSMYLRNTTVYHVSGLASIGCYKSSDAGYQTAQYLLDNASQTWGTAYSEQPTGWDNDWEIIMTMQPTDPWGNGCNTLFFGPYQTPELTLNIASVTDPTTGVAVVGGSLTPFLGDRATSLYNYFVELSPSDRTATLTITETYQQTTITRNGALFSQTNYNPDVKNVVVDEP